MKYNAQFCMLLFTMCACAEVKSSAINTDGMYANFDLYVEGSLVKASASFKVGDAISNTYIELDPADTVSASNTTESMALTHAELFNAHVYNGVFTVTEPDAEYTFALNRENETSAPNSTVSLPMGIQITTPSNNSTYSLSSGSAIEIKWENRTEDLINVEMSGDCVNYFSTGEITDSAAFTIVGSDITPDEPIGGCDATITVERLRQGNIDPAYEDGSVKARQTVTITLQIDP